jgi:hypothetical protein
VASTERHPAAGGRSPSTDGGRRPGGVKGPLSPLRALDPAAPPPGIGYPTLSGLTVGWVVTAVRRDAEVKADRSGFFTSDRVAVRATCRVGFGYPHPAALVRIRLAAS